MAENRNFFRTRRLASGGRVLSAARLFGAGCALLAASALAHAEDAGLSSGAASLAAGKYDAAVRQLSSTVNADAVSRSDAARALYLRGIAYRKLGQPSRALADLGAAIWLGLPDQDRVRALVNRGLAYRATGLSKQADAELSAARNAGGNIDQLIAQDGGNAGAVAAFATEVRPGEEASAETKPSSPSGFASIFGSSSPPPPPATSRTADASPGWSVNTTEPPVNNAPKAPPPEAQGNWSTSVSNGPPPSSGNRVSRWFGSIGDVFGSSNQEAAPPPPVAQSTPSTPSTTTTVKRQAQAETATSWTTQTQSAETSQPSQGGTVFGRLFSRTADEPAAKPPSGGGAYRIQLANSNSEGEARALWQKVSRANSQLASAQPEIEKVNLGNFGTFYSLRIGPFSGKDESLKVCNALKRSGVDCSLVTPDMQ
jgi:tetratricopeptide (TPR) repeat protein